MVRILFIILMTISASAFADEVKYVTIEPITPAKQDYRDAWDKTHQFCYTDDAKEPHCLDIVGMGEVKIRDAGEWSTQAEDQRFVDKLSSEAREAGLLYDRIYVRYLALDKIGAKFVVHVHFINKGGSERMSQTIFVTGDYQIDGSGRKVQVRGMSFSSALEYLGGAIRAAVKLGSKSTTTKVIDEQIVRDNQGLLSIGESVVNTFLATSSAAAPVLRP